jgi:hypothetical protein
MDSNLTKIAVYRIHSIQQIEIDTRHSISQSVRLFKRRTDCIRQVRCGAINRAALGLLMLSKAPQVIGNSSNIEKE